MTLTGQANTLLIVAYTVEVGSLHTVHTIHRFHVKL